MDTLIIGNQSEQEVRGRILHAWNSGQAESAVRLDFANLDDAWKLLSPTCRAILQTMAGAGPLATREVARRMNRSPHGVHRHIHLLLHSGVIDRTPDGKVILPYKEVRFDCSLMIGKD